MAILSQRDNQGFDRKTNVYASYMPPGLDGKYKLIMQIIFERLILYPYKNIYLNFIGTALCWSDRGSGDEKHGRVRPMAEKHSLLMTDLILTHTKRGDRVFEPFAGSGVGGVVSMIHGRAWTGFENDEEVAGILHWRCDQVHHYSFINLIEIIFRPF